MKKEKELIRICPKCKSEDIDYATQLGGANIGGGDHYYCKTCDYGRFKFVVFDKVKKTELKNKDKKIKKIKK